MNIPTHLQYTESHEWVRVEADGAITVGITQHAAEALGDIVFVELPTEGRQFAAGEAVAVIESVKAASDIYAPISGTIIAVNEAALKDTPEQINADPYNTWLFQLKSSDNAASSQPSKLLTAQAYRQLINA